MKILAALSILLLTASLSAEEKFPIDPNRVNRTPQMVIDQLLDHYGKKFTGSYVQGLAITTRLHEQGLESIEPIVAGQLASPAKLRNGGAISGRLLFAEMAEQGHEKAKALALEAANLAFTESGDANAAMPFHNEMSDAIFMGGPILARAGSLTGDAKYFDQSVRQYRFVQNLCQRQDGIYRHSPLDESAWGRGNGFPAIGLAMILQQLPPSHSEYDSLVKELTKHLTALKPHQDSSGMWHQVIDHPESYPEFTCTCMISYAILVGIQNRWLEHQEWDPTIHKSWKAILSRISLDGREVNGACTGTGKQKNLEAYFKRKEIHGYDDRGGSMALLFASEMKKYLESK